MLRIFKAVEKPTILYTKPSVWCNYRNFLITNVARQGNCFLFNSEYNFEDTIMYEEIDEGYLDRGMRRKSSLTGPRFGLNLVISLDQLNYMKGEITKQVWELFFIRALHNKHKNSTSSIIFSITQYSYFIRMEHYLPFTVQVNGLWLMNSELISFLLPIQKRQ